MPKTEAAAVSIKSAKIIIDGHGPTKFKETPEGLALNKLFKPKQPPARVNFRGELNHPLSCTIINTSKK